MSDYLDNIASADNVVPTALQGDAVDFNGTNHYFTRDGVLTAPIENISVLEVLKPTNLNLNDDGYARDSLQFGKIELGSFSKRDVFRILSGDIVQYIKNNNVVTLVGDNTTAYHTVIGVAETNNFKYYNNGWLKHDVSVGGAGNAPFDYFNIGCTYDPRVGAIPRGFYEGSIKRIEILNFVISKSQSRRAYNEGTFQNIATNSQFLVKLDGDNYNPATGIWTDTSPNGYVFNAQGATNPTKSTFI